MSRQWFYLFVSGGREFWGDSAPPPYPLVELSIESYSSLGSCHDRGRGRGGGLDCRSAVPVALVGPASVAGGACRAKERNGRGFLPLFPRPLAEHLAMIAVRLWSRSLTRTCSRLCQITFPFVYFMY